jgi:hypothetical protein
VTLQSLSDGSFRSLSTRVPELPALFFVIIPATVAKDFDGIVAPLLMVTLPVAELRLTC